jgi:hypothetical protein
MQTNLSSTGRSSSTHSRLPSCAALRWASGTKSEHERRKKQRKRCHALQQRACGARKRTVCAATVTASHASISAPDLEKSPLHMESCGVSTGSIEERQTPISASFMRNLVSLTEKISIFGGFKTVFMEDSENGGKGDIQARNRTVVNLPREKIEKRCFE